VTKGTLLVVGEIVGNAEEVCETAVAAGFEPLVVVFDGQEPRGDWDTKHVSELSPQERLFPALAVKTRKYPDLAGFRVDRRWRISFERHLMEAEASGISHWISLVHPSSHISVSAVLGRGVYVGPLATVASYTTVGDFTFVGRSCSIGHHVTIGPGGQCGPGVIVPGNVKIGPGVVVGPGAVFINNVTVGENSLVGAGSVVTRSVKAGSQVLGNPARAGHKPLSALRKYPRDWAKWLLRRLGLFDRAKVWYRSFRN
jgi:serine acetyltransferase